jgi:hypothetical protein
VSKLFQVKSQRAKLLIVLAGIAAILFVLISPVFDSPDATVHILRFALGTLISLIAIIPAKLVFTSQRPSFGHDFFRKIECCDYQAVFCTRLC